MVRDGASPSDLRFIDTSSSVDIISFKHAFTNNPGVQQPTFNLQIYESDTGLSGTWITSTLSSESNSIFLINSKEYIKIELEIFSDVEDISSLGLLLYINVAINDISSPVISDYARSILKKFPTWTDIYEDSIEQATPELATPITVGGKFVNSLVGHYLDDFNTQLDIYNLNNFLGTSDLNIPAWGYVSYKIPAGSLSFVGDGIVLARVSSVEKFNSSRVTDYIFYHNIIDSQIVTLQEFDSLNIDGSLYHQEPILLFNIFDELGARVGLNRLYLEGNSNFKKRILDTYNNPPSVSKEGFKRTLRRELDIWRAYGATPDSNYAGATPEILEISDIESSTPYFSDSGVAEKRFYDFVKYINETYPSNIGYIDWSEGIWDYAGLNGEGIGYIPAVYDNATPLGEYFQAGVGDFDDLKIDIVSKDSSTVSFEGYFEASGFKTEGFDDYYMPIRIDYNYKAQHYKTVANPHVSNPNSATPFNAGVALVYEIYMPAHNQYSTPSSFYANLDYNDREDFFVYNNYLQTDSASPEYNYIKIVDSNNFTGQNLSFKEKRYDYTYENSLATPVNNSIDISKASSVRIVNKVKWDVNTQSYVAVPTGQYRVGFDEQSVAYSRNPTSGSYISKTTPNINYVNSNFKIGSTVYGTKEIIGYSNIVEENIILNSDNDPYITKDETLLVSDLVKNLLIPTDATPSNLIIEGKKINSLPVFTPADIIIGQSQPVDIAVSEPLKYGGRSYYPLLDTDYFVPSSPNIVINSYAATDHTLTNPIYSGYLESATFNYSSLPHTLAITNNLSSTPNYPFKDAIWYPIDDGELRTTPMIKGYLDYLGNVYKNTENVDETNSPFDLNKRDTFLDTYSFNREDFGLVPESNNQYLITEIEPVTNNKDIVLRTSQKSVLRDSSILLRYNENSSKIIREIYDSSNDVYYFSPVDVYAEFGKGYAGDITQVSGTNPISMNTGWLNLAEDDYYVYSKPIVEIYFGKYFGLELNNVPTHGAPILVDVQENDIQFDMNEMAFSDPATPGNVVFSNEEILIGSNESALYLAHTAIKDITIKDNYTGKILTRSPLNPEFYIWSIASQSSTPGTTGYIPFYLDGEFYISIDSDFIASGQDKYSQALNKLMIYNSAATGGSIIVPGREYTVSYNLSRAFYVDRNNYSHASESYNAKIYFSATPSVNSTYKITYESALQEHSTPLGINLNTSDLPIEEGYVYLSNDEYDFGTAIVTLSPQTISKNIDDIIYLLIRSYDVAGNFKPYQTFRISSDLLDVEEEYLTTDEFGLAKTKLRFVGISTSEMFASILVSGLSYPDPLAHVNSEANTFIFGSNIEFIENYIPEYSLKAVASKGMIESDGISENYIKGYLSSNNIPPASTPIVYWRKARSFHGALNDVGYKNQAATPGRTLDSGYVSAPGGKFSIGPFYSQVRNDPGYWFVTVETEMAATPSATPNTIYGDISYWYERFDNIQYLNEETVLPSYYKSIGNDPSIIATPNFTYNIIDQEDSSTPYGELNWVPPTWVPIDYYSQYQMGLFGSTPNVIATPNTIIGYEES